MYTCMCTCMCIYVCVHVCVYVCVSVCVYVCVYVYIYMCVSVSSHLEHDLVLKTMVTWGSPFSPILRKPHIYVDIN